MFVLFNIIFATVLCVLCTVAMMIMIKTEIVSNTRWGYSMNEDTVPMYLQMYLWTYYLSTILPSFAVAVRRLHDTGRSGWWFLISLIPLVGAIWLLVMLTEDSQSGENRYGKNPKTSLYRPDLKTRKLSATVTCIIAAIIGIVGWSLLLNRWYLPVGFPGIFGPSPGVNAIYGITVSLLLLLTGILLYPRKSLGYRNTTLPIIIMATLMALGSVWNITRAWSEIHYFIHDIWDNILLLIILFTLLEGVLLLFFAIALLQRNQKLLRSVSIILTIIACAIICMNIAFNHIILGYRIVEGYGIADHLHFFLSLYPIFQIALMTLAGVALADRAGAQEDAPNYSAQVDVQSDWQATSGDAMIPNKPAINDIVNYLKLEYMNYFYMDGNNQQQGPVTANELLKMGVTRNTRVWKQGMSDWQTAGSIPELSGIFPPPASQSATPPLSPPPVASYVSPPPPSYQTENAPPPPPQKPDNLLVWSILATVLCCLPTGIVAIVYSNKVDNLWNVRDYDGAKEAANTAKTWCFVSLGLGVVAIIIGFMSGLLGALS
jgi:uncharacterized membrane protein YhaH (DUF805 family)